MIKKLYIEPTSRCNLNCVMCFRNSWIDENFGDLPMPLFYKVMNDEAALKETHTVFFGGMGEPLAHPHIIEMITCCREKGLRTELLTNGTMLTTDTSQALVDAGLDKLWVSIDSFEEEQYGEIQVGSRFSLITQQIQEFNRMRQGMGIELGISIVLMKSNLPQLSRMDAYCEKIKADDVNLSHMIPNTSEAAEDTLWQLTERAESMVESDYWNSEFLTIGNGETAVEEEAGNSTAARFRFLPEDFERLYGGNPIESMVNEKLEIVWRGKVPERTKNRCRFVAEGNCFVRWDGDVCPCMGLLHSAATYMNRDRRTVWHYSFGNVESQSLHEIWNREEFRGFRERVIQFEFSPCTSCGGCELRQENKADCFGNLEPTCGACLWGQGFVRCP